MNFIFIFVTGILIVLILSFFKIRSQAIRRQVSSQSTDLNSTSTGSHRYETVSLHPENNVNGTAATNGPAATNVSGATNVSTATNVSAATNVSDATNVPDATNVSDAINVSETLEINSRIMLNLCKLEYRLAKMEYFLTTKNKNACSNRKQKPKCKGPKRE